MMANKNQVIETLKRHPEWSSVQIAAHLDCNPEYVRSTVKRNGLTLAMSTGSKGDGIRELGHACKAVGLTVADITEIGRLIADV